MRKWRVCPRACARVGSRVRACSHVCVRARARVSVCAVCLWSSSTQEPPSFSRTKPSCGVAKQSYGRDGWKGSRAREPVRAAIVHLAPSFGCCARFLLNLATFDQQTCISLGSCPLGRPVTPSSTQVSHHTVFTLDSTGLLQMRQTGLFRPERLMVVSIDVQGQLQGVLQVALGTCDMLSIFPASCKRNCRDSSLCNQPGFMGSVMSSFTRFSGCFWAVKGTVEIHLKACRNTTADEGWVERAVSAQAPIPNDTSALRLPRAAPCLDLMLRESFRKADSGFNHVLPSVQPP